MPDEVRYDCMRPRQIVAARERCPVAYLPIGTLEWHGPHSPVGLDAIKAHAIAVRCAQVGGGLVFPALFYGESREEGLMEVGAADHEGIWEEMHLPPGNFAPGYMRSSPREQYENYQRLLLHCLYEIQSLGFKVIVLVPGHYPLVDHARAACCIYHQTRFNGKRAQCITWSFTGYELVQDEFPDAGDHAGYWETSLMLALRPDLMDLAELPAGDQRPTGTLTGPPIQQANAEFGERALALIVSRAVEQVRRRLEKPADYYAHGLRF